MILWRHEYEEKGILNGKHIPVEEFHSLTILTTNKLRTNERYFEFLKLFDPIVSFYQS